MNEKYIQELKEANPDIKIVPRVYLLADDKYLIQGLSIPSQINDLVDIFIQFIL